MQYGVVCLHAEPTAWMQITK